MWKLQRPDYSGSDSFELCCSRIRDDDLKERMGLIAQSVTDAAEAYDDAAEMVELHLVDETDGVDNIVTTDEMVKLYTGRMVGKKAPGRVVYDSIMALAPHGRCPLCGHRVVSTLDHLLSKQRYPLLTVTPNNLVPSCSDCNKAKLEDRPTCEEDQFLHPYFDGIEDDLWLSAEVVEGAPPSVRFFVTPHEDWPDETGARVENQFRRLGLSRLYTSQAAEELANVRYQVALLHDQAGAEAVKAYLEETHQSRRHSRVNSWQTAFYAALAENDWYCEGGFASE